MSTYNCVTLLICLLLFSCRDEVSDTSEKELISIEDTSSYHDAIDTVLFGGGKRIPKAVYKDIDGESSKIIIRNTRYLVGDERVIGDLIGIKTTTRAKSGAWEEYTYAYDSRPLKYEPYYIVKCTGVSSRYTRDTIYTPEDFEWKHADKFMYDTVVLKNDSTEFVMVTDTTLGLRNISSTGVVLENMKGEELAVFPGISYYVLRDSFVNRYKVISTMTKYGGMKWGKSVYVFKERKYQKKVTYTFDNNIDERFPVDTVYH